MSEANDFLTDSQVAEEVNNRTANLSNNEKTDLWNSLKGKYQRGDRLEGIIFIKAPFGVFLDIGEAFPALLRIVDMKNLDYNAYRADSCYQLNEKVQLEFIYMPEHFSTIDVHEWGES